MIGVAVQENERAIVSEFFELFKTPWEFYRRGARYDVVLCTSDTIRGEMPRLVIIFEGHLTPFDAQHGIAVHSRPGGMMISDEGKELPIHGFLATFPGTGAEFVREQLSREPVAFVTKRGNATILRVGYNLFAEVRILLSEGQPARFASIPTLDEHISWLRDYINLSGIPTIEIPPVPEGYTFIGCLTHDIDHPLLRNHLCDHTMFGFLYRSTVGTWLDARRRRRPIRTLWKNSMAACLLPFVYLGFAKDFWSTFDRYMEIEATGGSTFFVIPQRSYAGRTTDGFCPVIRASGYGVGEVIPQLRNIVSAGGEVGLHGIDAWLDAGAGRNEKEKVCQAVGIEELGVRMHWLYFGKDSPAILDQAGFTYDSTIGFRDTVGYRAGTVQAYRPIGSNHLLELPLHVMDTALFYPGYMNLSQKQAEEVVWHLVSDFDRIGGALTINWHDRSIAPERLWDDFYLRLLRELKGRRAWLPNAAKAIAWFRKRRSAKVELSWSDTGILRARGRMDAVDTLPGLRLRLHKPRAQSLTVPAPARSPARFVDTELNCTTEVEYSA